MKISALQGLGRQLAAQEEKVAITGAMDGSFHRIPSDINLCERGG